MKVFVARSGDLSSASAAAADPVSRSKVPDGATAAGDGISLSRQVRSLLIDCLAMYVDFCGVGTDNCSH